LGGSIAERNIILDTVYLFDRNIYSYYFETEQSKKRCHNWVSREGSVERKVGGGGGADY
jgi:hypothetical protein